VWKLSQRERHCNDNPLTSFEQPLAPTSARPVKKLVRRVNVTDVPSRQFIPTDPNEIQEVIPEYDLFSSPHSDPLELQVEHHVDMNRSSHSPPALMPATPAPPKHSTTAMTNVKIRKEAPATACAATTVVTKSAKTTNTGTRGRVRASDFDDLSKSLIEGTISIYKAKLSAKHPFPERVEDRDAVKDSWMEVCTERNVQVELEEDAFKLVMHLTYFDTA
jgi:hypothetical protein